MDSKYEAFFRANENAWDVKTPIHITSDFYRLDKFKAGQSSLYPIETEQLGDLTGKSILHLQCHFGLDTISLVRQGADATGVDFSGASIQEARLLAGELQVPAKFIKENVYNIADVIQEKFDIVFCSYGALNWLPDLQQWAKIVYARLKPGGIFLVVDFHPLLISHECLEDDHITASYYQEAEPITRKRKGSYVDDAAPIEYVEYTWNHSIAEVVTALTTNGLMLKELQEFPYLPFNCFSNLVRFPDGNWRFKGYENKFPLCYAIKAQKV